METQLLTWKHQYWKWRFQVKSGVSKLILFPSYVSKLTITILKSLRGFQQYIYQTDFLSLLCLPINCLSKIEILESISVKIFDLFLKSIFWHQGPNLYKHFQILESILRILLITSRFFCPFWPIFQLMVQMMENHLKIILINSKKSSKIYQDDLEMIFYQLNH